MPAKDEAQQNICKNRRALHGFEITLRFQAGLVRTGTEVKACHQGRVQIDDAHVQIRNGEAYLVNAHIPEYAFGNRFNHEPRRNRKLLLHVHEIAKLADRLTLKGESVVPLSLYFKGGRVKAELGVGRGMGKVDKRQQLKERETARDLRRVMQSAKHAQGNSRLKPRG